ncbi:MAG: hypothetical protein IT313_01140 [Anaerolineales bacterium]|nr:hypothetical protein [Anaerolineales bacterium]
MAETLQFEGFIKDVSYQAHLTSDLVIYGFNEFDVNKAKSFGVINHPNGQVAYSKWTSPKRTRTYPFARLYNTYNAQKILTIIPVMKDEGLDGDLDKIQYSTISWMNLLNVYIVLAYYERADKNRSSKQKNRDKLTSQKLNAKTIKDQIKTIVSYKQSALHWNRTLFETRFVEIYEKAIASYELISSKSKVKVHPKGTKLQYLESVRKDYRRFRDISLRGSQGAALRESKTVHAQEFLEDGGKSVFLIENYLGGIYHLTVDEVLHDRGEYVIQESKNSTKKFLPSISDIKDGLFKLILFSNLDSLKVRGRKVKFSTRLKLTGYKVKGNIQFPCRKTEFDDFVRLNKVSRAYQETLHKLNLEATNNKNLTIEVRGNNG